MSNCKGCIISQNGWLKQIAVLLLLLGWMVPTLSKESPLKVVASFSILADIAQNIAGEHAEVSSLVGREVDLHEYQPSGRDRLLVEEADLLLWHGLGLESHFESLLTKERKRHRHYVSEGITPLGDEDHRGVTHPNPHAWMSPKAALHYVANIEALLSTYDPDNQRSYEANSRHYAEQIRALDRQLQEAFATIPEARRWIVTNEDSMRYFAHDYGFQRATLWGALALEEGTPQQMQQLIETVRRYQIEVLFSENTLSDRLIKQVARESGARYGGVIYTDALTAPDGAVPTYLELLEETATTILEAYRNE